MEEKARNCSSSKTLIAEGGLLSLEDQPRVCDQHRPATQRFCYLLATKLSQLEDSLSSQGNCCATKSSCGQEMKESVGTCPHVNMGRGGSGLHQIYCVLSKNTDTAI